MEKRAGSLDTAGADQPASESNGGSHSGAL